VVVVSVGIEAVVSVVEPAVVGAVVAVVVDSAQAEANRKKLRTSRMRIFLMGIFSFHSPVTPVRSMPSTKPFCITAYTRSTGRMIRIVAA